jgi:hypothetical protein
MTLAKGATFYSIVLVVLIAYVQIGWVFSVATSIPGFTSFSLLVAFIGVGLIALTECFDGQSRREALLRKLISKKRSMPMTQLVSQSGLSTSKVSDTVERSHLLAKSPDGSAVLNLELLVGNLLSHVDSMGEIDVASVCADWSLDVRFVVSLDEKMKDVVANDAGKMYSRPALAKILGKELEAKGVFDVAGEAKRRGFTYDGSNAVFSRERLKSSPLVSSSGRLLDRNAVVRSLMATLKEKGVVELSAELRKLGIYDATGLSVADGFAEQGYARIPGTSLITERSWLPEVKRRAKEMGVIDLKAFAESLGISRNCVGIVLSNYVEGFIDVPTDIFYTKGASVYGATASPPSRQYAASGFPKDVQVLRGGEFVGNRLRYKVKIVNSTKFVITDVTVSLVSYPRETLSIEGPIVKTVAKIDPGGFNSPLFEFLPTRDCVKGDVIAMVCYVDY